MSVSDNLHRGKGWQSSPLFKDCTITPDREYWYSGYINEPLGNHYTHVTVDDIGESMGTYNYSYMDDLWEKLKPTDEFTKLLDGFNDLLAEFKE